MKFSAIMLSALGAALIIPNLPNDASAQRADGARERLQERGNGARRGNRSNRGERTGERGQRRRDREANNAANNNAAAQGGANTEQRARGNNANRNRTRELTVTRRNLDRRIAPRGPRVHRPLARRPFARPPIIRPDRRFACLPRRAVRNRLFDRGFDVISMRRAGDVFVVRAFNPRGRRVRLEVDRCDGVIVARRRIDGPAHAVRRTIRRTLREIF